MMDKWASLKGRARQRAAAHYLRREAARGYAGATLRSHVGEGVGHDGAVEEAADPGDAPLLHHEDVRERRGERAPALPDDALDPAEHDDDVALRDHFGHLEVREGHAVAQRAEKAFELRAPAATAAHGEAEGHRGAELDVIADRAEELDDAPLGPGRVELAHHIAVRHRRRCPY